MLIEREELSVNEKIIKNITWERSRRPVLRGLVKRSLLDAVYEAQRIIAEAEANAYNITWDAKVSVDEERISAYKEGYENGLLKLNQYLIESGEDRNKILSGVEPELLKLSMKMAEKIIGREVKCNDALLIELVSNLLQDIRNRDKIIIRINTSDMDAIQEECTDLKEKLNRKKFIEITTGPDIETGTCIIQSESGMIATKLNVQLHILERALELF
jgi:type III secretion protein L